jgi:hypothetical protein
MVVQNINNLVVHDVYVFMTSNNLVLELSSVVSLIGLRPRTLNEA